MYVWIFFSHCTVHKVWKLLKMSLTLVILLDLNLQVFQNSSKSTIFSIFNELFVHSKCERSSLRLHCWMRLFLWFSNSVIWTLKSYCEFLWGLKDFCLCRVGTENTNNAHHQRKLVCQNCLLNRDTSCLLPWVFRDYSLLPSLLKTRNQCGISSIKCVELQIESDNKLHSRMEFQFSL